MANISSKKLENGFYKLYFIQLSDINGGETIYKFGITEYADVMYRFSSELDKFNIKVLCTWTLRSKEKAEAFESALLTIYNKWPSGDIMKIFESFRGNGELRQLNGHEKQEILNFMFVVKNNSKDKVTL